MNFVKNFLKENGIFILVIIAIFLLRIYVFTPFAVDGISMDYTLKQDDLLIGVKYFNIDRNDIVILDSPTVEGDQYIKRVIGLPGDTISMHDDVLYINGEAIDESEYLSAETIANNTGMEDLAEFVVPEGEYFVMGDNRNHSFDGTEFGPILEDSINAEILFRYWPLNRIGGL